MDIVYEGIVAELERRRRSEHSRERKASSWKWLAGALGTTQQAVSNWIDCQMPLLCAAEIIYSLPLD